MAPLANPLARKRSILGNRAKIRAIDLLRVNPNAELGAGTEKRLRAGNPGGFDPVGVLRGLAAQGGQDNENMAHIRQQALAGWNLQGQEEAGGNKAPQALPQAPAAPPAPAAPGNPIEARRQELLGRSGQNQISADLRQRILARMKREGARR